LLHIIFNKLGVKWLKRNICLMYDEYHLINRAVYLNLQLLTKATKL